MPQESHRRIVRELTSRGYNAEREAVTLLANARDSERAIDAVTDRAAPDTFVITAAAVRAVVDDDSQVVDDSRPAGNVDARNEGGTGNEDGTGNEGGTGIDGEGQTTEGEEPTTDEERAEPPAAEKAPTDMGGSDDPTPADELVAGDDGGGEPSPAGDADSSVSGGSENAEEHQKEKSGAVETRGSSNVGSGPGDAVSTAASTGGSEGNRSPTPPDIANDVTGQSTGTGEYEDFVSVFQDRYERLSTLLKSRVNHRPAEAIQNMPGGSEAEMVGMVNDIRSTASGHFLVELEDTTGTFPCLILKDREFADVVDDLLLDECIAVQGTLADDAGIMFVDSVHFPDVPRTYRPDTADRHVQAALISDVHVGSQEFAEEAWNRFTEWLHTEAAEPVEYLLIAGDMVEGVGVYPDQDEELDVVDIYDQYEAFSEYLKQVPGDMEIVMIPGNHDAVRLAEPQPAFDEELRDIMSAHEARFTGNPSMVTVEGVSVLMYHGVSLDEVIAELPEEKASYDEPHKAMYQLLRKRHVAPQYGGHTRLAPEEQDYLTIDEVPDVFHTGHVHKLGWGKYHNVLAVNSGCWQEQTDFQKSVNIDPDYGYAPILDLDTLDMTVRKFV